MYKIALFTDLNSNSKHKYICQAYPRKTMYM